MVIEKDFYRVHLCFKEFKVEWNLPIYKLSYVEQVIGISFIWVEDIFELNNYIRFLIVREVVS